MAQSHRAERAVLLWEATCFRDSARTLAPSEAISKAEFLESAREKENEAADAYGEARLPASFPQFLVPAACYDNMFCTCAIVFVDEMTGREKFDAFCMDAAAAPLVVLMSPLLLGHGKVWLVHRACVRSGTHLWEAWRFFGMAMISVSLQIYLAKLVGLPAPSSNQWQLMNFLILSVIGTSCTLVDKGGKALWDGIGEMPFHRMPAVYKHSRIQHPIGET